MLDEDVVIRDFRNSNERFLILNVLLMIGLPSLFFGGSSPFVIGLFCALGILAPINTFNYIYSWSPSLAAPISKYAMAILPFVAGIAITCLSWANPIFHSYEGASGLLFTMDTAPKSSPVMASDNLLSPLLDDFTVLAAVMCALSIYFITNSRFVIRKVLCFSSYMAVAFLVLGLAIGFVCSLGVVGEREPTSAFATFTDASDWASYATIWAGAAFAMAVYSEQRFRLLPIAYSARFHSLLAAFLLWGSALYSGKPLQCLISSAIGFFALAVLAVDIVPLKFNASRHEALRYISSHSRRLKKMVLPFAVYAILSVCAFILTLFYAQKILADTRLVYAAPDGSGSITYAEKMALFDDAKKMIGDHKLFGCGSSSFAAAFSFYQGSDIGSAAWPNAGSDLLQKLAENGVVGLILSSITFVGFLLVWIFRFSYSASGLVMMSTIAGILILAVFETPFESPAVLVSFWVLAMSAFRWDSSRIG